MSEMSGPDDRNVTPVAGRRFARWRTRRVAIVAAVALVFLAGGVVAVLTLGGDGGLPAPRVLDHDPVPAERHRATLPADCGVTATTLSAITPHPELQRDGTAGECEWYWAATGKHGSRRLTVRLSIVRAGAGVPNARSRGNSSVAAAIDIFSAAAKERGSAHPSAVAGLGDESFTYSERHDMRTVVFRAGNVIANAQYTAEGFTTKLKNRPLSDARKRAGVFRAAADVARALGAPAKPELRRAPSPRAAPTLPESACDPASEGLRERLLGDDADSNSGESDPLNPAAASTGGSARSCTWLGNGREITIAFSSAKPTGLGAPVADARREYLRRYLDARAEKPISAHDERYFHALSGLGDQAFCAYVDESVLPGISARGAARVSARAGGVLVTVTYGNTSGGYDDDDAEPLSRTDAVNGAYAVAVRAVRAARG